MRKHRPQGQPELRLGGGAAVPAQARAEEVAAQVLESALAASGASAGAVWSVALGQVRALAQRDFDLRRYPVELLAAASATRLTLWPVEGKPPALALPVACRGLAAALVTLAREDRAFSPEERRAAERVLAAQADLLHESILLGRIQACEGRMASLGSALEAVYRLPDLAGQLQAMVAALRPALGLDLIAVYLPTPSGELRLAASTATAKLTRFRQTMWPQQLPADAPLLRRGSRAGAPLPLSTFSSLEPLDRSKLEQAQIGGLVTLPIRLGNHARGALLATVRELGQLSEAELKFLHLLVSELELLAGQGMLREQLEQQQAREQRRSGAEEYEKLLLAALEASIDGILVADGNQQVQVYNRAALEILGVPREQVVKRVSELPPLPEMRDAKGRQVSSYRALPLASAIRERLVVPMQEWSFLRQGERAYISTTAAPLLEGDHLLGAIAVIRDTTREHRALEVEREHTHNQSLLLEFTGELLAAHLEVLQSEYARGGTFSQRTREMASRYLQALHDIAYSACRHTCLAADSARCALFLREESQLRLVEIADATGGYRPEVGHRQVELSALPWGAEKGERRPEPVVVPEAAGTPWASAIGDPLRSVLLIPLSLNAELVGAMVAYDPGRERDFTHHQRLLAGELAAHGVLAIKCNQRLYSDQRQVAVQAELVTVRERVRSSQSRDQTLSETVTELGEYLEADRVIVAWAEPLERPMVREWHRAGLRPAAGLDFGRFLQESDIGQALLRGEGAIIGEFPAGFPFYFPELGVTALLAWPVMVRGQLVAALGVVQSSGPRYWQGWEVELVQEAANLLTLGIEADRARRLQEERVEMLETMMAELNHRVKNNLAAVAGLLEMQLSPERAQVPKEVAIRESVGRIRSLSVVHELLYEGRPQVVDLKRISRGLLELARRVHAPPDLELECHVEGDQVELGSREGSSLALVINELATNAIRHGFAGRKHGQIWAHLRQADSEVELVMEDDGRGLAPGFDPTQPTGLGLQIVKGLVERELRGRFALERREPGTRARVVVDLARLPWAAPAEGNGADTAG